MADATPTRRVLPARQRRESAAKRQANSPPKPVTPVPASKSAATSTATESKLRKRSEKRIKIVHIDSPTRSASTPVSTSDETLPTKVTASCPLPTSGDKQAEKLSAKQYQSVADSAIVAASLHRSRMQWLCDGVFKKYWTKPIKRKKAPVEEPPNNPDIKSMQKLGTATITIEPHSFEATLYVVREAVLFPPAVPRPPMGMPTPSKPMLPNPSPATTPVVRPNANAPQHVTPTAATSTVTPAVAPPEKPKTAAPATSTHLPTPPGGAKKTDPVIQMLASRAAADNSLKELMKVVATSRATPEQLKQFQAHIDEFNVIVKKQEAEKAARAKQATPVPIPAPAATPTPTPAPAPMVAPLPIAAQPAGTNTPRNSTFTPAANPTPVGHFASYPTQPRPEPIVKHVIIEFNSPLSATQSANSDRWLFPEYAALDTQYGGTEMTCSFFAERKGSDVLALMKDLPEEERKIMSTKWKADTEYFQPVTMVVRAAHSRTIATIAHSAKSLPEVQKYMREVMEKKTRARQEFLVHRLPKDRLDSTVDFVDSAVELSTEDDDLLDFYPL